MTKLKELKKELKSAQKELRRGKNINDNKELIDSLQTEIKLKTNIKSKGYKTSILDKVLKKFDKYDPDAKLLDNVKYVGNNIMRFRFDRNQYNGGHFSKKLVQKISNDMSDYLQSKGINGRIMTSMRYGDLGWRSGYFSDIGDDISLYNPADSGIEMDNTPEVKSFVIYTVVKARAVGGTDIKNDCLYNCLSQLIYNLSDYFSSPEALKKYLGLKRNDKIPLECIPKIETKLRTFQINIRGDYVYTSTIKSEKVINLSLINEHYTLDKTVNKKPLLVKNIKFNEKHPVLYDKLTFEIYDGKVKRVITNDERNDILYNFKSPYILIDRDENNNKMTIEEEYKKLIIIIDTLKKESNGIINLYKSGSYKNASLDLFDKFTQYLNEPEQILQDEAEWINLSSIGALIWAKPYEGELYKYDVKSLYPHLMKSTTLKFPIKRGEFQKLDQFGEYIAFGIYRCKVLKSDDANINKLFRFNDKHYYSSVSLDHAKTLGLKLELIQDNKPNFLFYSRDKLITFNEVFKPFVDFMFELKDKKKVEKAKDILNILWGALCEVEKKKYFCDKDIIINEEEEIYKIAPYKNNEDIDVITTNKINKRYKTNYARLCPFLISQGRRHMSNIMFPIKEHIHRCQTDGFLSDIKIHSNTDVKLGELKYEGFTEYGIIKNCINKVETHF